MPCSPPIKKASETEACFFYWRWREALAAVEAPVLPGRRSRSVFRPPLPMMHRWGPGNEKHRPRLDSLTQGKLLPCSPPIKKASETEACFFYWRWREALAAVEAPVLPGRRSRSVFRPPLPMMHRWGPGNEKHRPRLDSLTQGKLLPCSPPIKKASETEACFFYWRWREALAAVEAPVLPGRRSRSVFRPPLPMMHRWGPGNEKHRPRLDSLTQGKLLPCSPPIKKASETEACFFYWRWRESNGEC